VDIPFTWFNKIKGPTVKTIVGQHP